MSGAVLVVADDLTGANATAAGFARAGLRAVTVGANQPGEVIARFATEFDAVVASTDTRHATAEEAAARVSATVEAAAPGQWRLVCHRVDSTLRGNLGASTWALREAVAVRQQRRVVALLSPAHPAAGRQTVEGTQLLDGIRLEDTELAQDPRSPLDTSDVAQLLRRQASLRVAHLPLSLVTGSFEPLVHRVREHVSAGAEVVIADALTVNHVQRAADAALAAVHDVEWVGVDPGPGAVALARAKGMSALSRGAPLLAVSGSATELTRAQLARMRERHRVRVAPLVYANNSPVPDPVATANTVAAELAAASAGDVVLVATVISEADVVALTSQQAAALPEALGATVRAILRESVVDGLYVTGGDAAAAVLAALDASGLEIEAELRPLAVSGMLVGGSWNGLPVVTKGGLVGDTDTAADCMTHLNQAAEAHRRRVHAA